MDRERKFAILAVLVPASSDAEEMVLLRRNAAKVDYASYFTSLVGRRDIHCVVVPITGSSMLGRQSIAFGSCRSSTFQLPEGHDVCTQHFILFIDPITQSLQIRDTSKTGIWVSAIGLGEQTRLLHHQALEIISSLQIQFGLNTRFRFQLYVDRDAVKAVIPKYLESLALVAIPSCITSNTYTASKAQTKRPTSRFCTASDPTGIGGHQYILTPTSCHRGIKRLRHSANDYMSNQPKRRKRSNSMNFDVDGTITPKIRNAMVDFWRRVAGTFRYFF